MVVSIPSQPDRVKPVIYNLVTDYWRWGLTIAQRDEILNNRFPNRSGYGRPEFLFFHTQVGNTRGSLLHWASVQASSTVMVQKDGSILNVIDEDDGPWTNGDEKAPTPEANEILAMGGNPNNWSLSCEGEGDPDTPYTDAQLDAIVWWAEDAIIRYPNIVNNHIWSLLRHRFVNSIDKWNCPDRDSDPAVQGLHFDPVVTAINTWLDTAVVPAKDTETPVPPATIYPPGMSEARARRLYGTVTVPWSSKTFTFDPTRSECQVWLARGKARIPAGERYDHPDARWPELDDIIRSGDRRIHIYRWNDGSIYEKIIREE